jgi:hypothetical protein
LIAEPDVLEEKQAEVEQEDDDLPF